MKGSLFRSRSPSPSPSHFSHHHHHHHMSPSSTPPRTPPRQTFSDSIMDENLDLAESVVRNWDVDSNTHPLFSNNNNTGESRRFLESVADLQKAMHHYVSHKSSSSQQLIRAQNLMQMAIKRLEKEFYVILSANRKNLDSESISNHSSVSSTRSCTLSDILDGEQSMEEDDEDVTRKSPSEKAMSVLKSIAEAMIACGYAKECITIYKLGRKSMIDEALYNLGVLEKLNQNQMQKMEWKVLEPKIKNWLHSVKFAVRTLFHGERILCDTVFSSSERIAESCFTDISKDAALNLFKFPENFSKSKKLHSPENIFRALDMYEVLSNLWPEIESIFSYESLMSVRREALTAMVQLGDAVRIMLTQFEAAIQKDSSKVTPGGNVHPLTRYVMNFLVFLGDYSGAVTDIVADWMVNQTPLPKSYFLSPLTSGEGSSSSLDTTAERFGWLVHVLLCKLDGKATQCDDVALSYLFLANNLNYVVSKVKGSNLGLVLGGEWVAKNQSKVGRYVTNFERMSWGNVVASLPEDPTAEISPENLDRFYRSFEGMYKKQGSWVVPDPKLRDEVKVSLSRKIVSGYRLFYEKHRGTGMGVIIRYAPEDFDNYLSDLFFVEGVCKTTSYERSSGSSTSRVVKI